MAKKFLLPCPIMTEYQTRPAVCISQGHQVHLEMAVKTERERDYFTGSATTRKL